MDFKRYILIGAIAVLLIMLLTEWVQFKKQHSAIDNVATYQQQTNKTAVKNQDTATPQVGELPQTPVAQAPADEDVPTIEADVADSTYEATTQQHSKIHVRTDTLEVHISTNGGDIVFAALPKHYAQIDTPDIPFTLLEQSEQRTYIAQSGLAGRNGIDTRRGRAQFTSASSEYLMAEDQNELVVDLNYLGNSEVSVTKRFRFRRGEYLIDVEYLVSNNSSQVWSGALYGQIKRDNSPDPTSDTSGMGLAPYLGAALNLPDELYNKVTFDEIAENKFAKQKVQGGWIALVQHYFVSAWVPAADQTNTYSTQYVSGNTHIIRFTSPVTTIEPGTSSTIAAKFYAGPKDQYTLEKISPGLELTVDYGWLWWIAQPLFWLLTNIHDMLGNWGYAIIAVTILVKALFFHLNAKAYTSMANMRKVQPKLMKIRELYADDRQKQSQEMMNLYKKEKINPLGGCLPVLVQMPVFIALYWVLMESVELRHAPFILWINDLSVMDPYFVLPLIMGVSMFIQQKLNPPPPDPLQAKVMQWMPILFTFFFLFFPAGLVLYWVVNNILSIAQQYVITKRVEAT